MIKCPKCGESYYRENYSTTTALYWAPIYKNGVLINENPNTTTTYCTCCNCGNNFTINSKDENQQLLQASLDDIVSGSDADLTKVHVL